MLNFSIVGRNADIKQRKEYSQWDKIHNERSKIANFINNKYDDLEASVGGSISIDIIIKGHDKGQIIKNLINEEVKGIIFVGDRCSPGGNDYGIIRELERSDLNFSWFNVSGPQETFELIKNNSMFC
jgi:hydroxymethylpyrimidine pyrophosphatase-like HAD family hydrolase